MKKICVFIVVSLFLNLNVANALKTNLSLEEMIDNKNNTQISDSKITLSKKSLNLNNLYVAQDYSDAPDSNIFITSNNGVYKNIHFDDLFYQKQSWPEELKTGVFNIAFNGEFSDKQDVLAYNENNIYYSNDAGESWYFLYENDERLLKVDFGPDYFADQKLYFITESGLYRYNPDNGNKSLLLENDTEGTVRDINYFRRTNISDRFYVAKGDKILKTNDYGEDWMEVGFDTPVVNIAVLPDGSFNGNVALVTEGNKLFYENNDMEFYEIEYPSEEIYGIRYAPEWDVDVLLIYTEKGFYITYDIGDNWSKLDYGINFIENPLKDFHITFSGGDLIVFAILGDKLYRDLWIEESFDEYMNGIEVNDYNENGSVESTNLINLENIEIPQNNALTSATLNVSEELSGQTINYYLTADGSNWEQVMPGELHEFEFPGTSLKWKAEFVTSDPSVTPTISDISIEYDFTEVTQCVGFTDVAVDDPNCDVLSYVKSEGIFTGYLEGSFKPDEPINRAEVVKVITEGFDYTILEDPGDDLGFSDVIIGEWYMPYLYTAKEAGIIEGYPDGTYKPEQTVNYVEMMKIFLETANVEFSEATEDVAWYQKYVNYAKTSGLVIYEDFAEGMKRIDVAKLFYKWNQLENI